MVERVDSLYKILGNYLAMQRGRLAMITLGKLFKDNPGEFHGYVHAWIAVLHELREKRVVVDSAGRVWRVKRIVYNVASKKSVHVYFSRDSTGVTELSPGKYV
jgi:hypothetical protein